MSNNNKNNHIETDNGDKNITSTATANGTKASRNSTTSTSSVVAQVRRVISDCKQFFDSSADIRAAAATASTTSLQPSPSSQQNVVAVIEPQEYVERLKRIVDDGQATLDEHEAAVVASYLRVFAESWTTRAQQTADEIAQVERKLQRKRMELNESKLNLREKHERLSSAISSESESNIGQKNAKTRPLQPAEIPAYVSVVLLLAAQRTCHNYYIDEPRDAVERVIEKLRASTEHLQTTKLTDYQQHLKTVTLSKKQTLIKFVAQRENEIETQLLPSVSAHESQLAVGTSYVQTVAQELERVKATERGGRAYIADARHKNPALGNFVQKLIVPSTSTTGDESKITPQQSKIFDTATAPIARAGQFMQTVFSSLRPTNMLSTTRKAAYRGGNFPTNSSEATNPESGLRELIKTTKRVADNLLDLNCVAVVAPALCAKCSTVSTPVPASNNNKNKNRAILIEVDRMLRTRRQTILCQTLIACLDSVSDIFKLDVQTLYAAINACQQHRQRAAEARAERIKLSRDKSQRVRKHIFQPKNLRTNKLRTATKATTTRYVENGSGDGISVNADVFRDTAVKLYNEVLDVTSSSSSSLGASFAVNAAVNALKRTPTGFFVGSVDLDDIDSSTIELPTGVS